MADINKVWLSGTVETQPTFEQIGTGTPLLCFRLRVQERYVNRQNQEQYHQNFIKIECLGKLASRVSETVHKGGRFMVDGYVRQNKIGTRDDVRVRAYAVYADESLDAKNYGSGLETALGILEKSLDLDSAKEKIKLLLTK